MKSKHKYRLPESHKHMELDYVFRWNGVMTILQTFILRKVQKWTRLTDQQILHSCKDIGLYFWYSI